MPRKPQGDHAMTSTERVHAFRERQRAKNPVLTDRQKLIKARQEIEELRKAGAAGPSPNEAQAAELADARAEIARLRKAATKAAAKAAPAAKPAPLIDAERSKLEFELHVWRNEAAMLRDEVTKLKAKIVKPVKPPPLDPESEAARQIDALKKINKSLRQKVDRLMPSAVKLKVAKALTEQTTDREKRLDALQAWNGLGLNNIGR